MTPHEKAVEAAEQAIYSEIPNERADAYAPIATAAITAYLASMEAQKWVMVEQPVSTATDTRIAELEAELKMERERFGQIADRTNEALHISKHEAANWRNLYLKMEAEVERLKAEPLVPVYPPTTGDGWIPWEGGWCPVSATSLVDVKLRGGAIHLADARDPSLHWEWRHFNNSHDIIAYRVVQP